MRAKFIFEKVIERGEKFLKFVRFENVLRYENLPDEYTQTTPSFWSFSDSIVTFNGDIRNLYLGVSYTLDEVAQHIGEAKRAGERLTAINRKLKKQNGGWAGTTEIEI
ncbi:MAG: hypothetical protein WC455_27510 [Dehalococcoidia bacterium]|jgi:hypothetical protein